MSASAQIPEAAPIAVPVDTNAGQAIRALYAKINEIIRTLAQEVVYLDTEITTPSTPNEEFEFPHGLGHYPQGYEVIRKDRACDVYSSSEGSWSQGTIRLACNTASATVVIRVF